MSHFVALSRHTGDMKTLLRIDSSARKQGSHSREHFIVISAQLLRLRGCFSVFSSLPNGDRVAI